MSTLKFVDTHNMVAFLEKPAEYEGFEKIIDFLSVNPIKYALTVNPTIFVSCIDQFWSTGVVKKVNGEPQVHALIDGKRIVVFEATIRRDLHLADEGGVDCLPNATIFEEITRMGYEKPSQKLTFYKAFFSMLRNLDTKAVKFLMYPRFIQLFVNHQVEGLPSHKRKYIAPSHTKKIFSNMKRVGKHFFGNVTPLFLTMVVQNQPQPPTITQTPTPTITTTPTTSTPTTSIQTPTQDQPTTSVRPSQPQKQRIMKPTRKDTDVSQPSEPDMVADEDVIIERVTKQSNDLLSGEDRLKLQELMEICTNLQRKVLTLEETKTTQAAKIISLKKRVNKLEKGKKTRTHKLKRLYKVGLSARVVSSEDEAILGDQKDASKQGRKIANIDKDADITLVHGAQGRNDDIMFDIDDLAGDEVVVETEAASKNVNLNEDEVTLAQTLQKMKSTTPREKRVAIREKEQEKNKLVLISKKLEQAQFDEEARIANEEAFRVEEANIAWNDIQAKIDADYELAQRLQAEEQEELTDAEKAKLFVQLLESRKKNFAAKRAEDQRSKPPTKAQKRKTIAMKRVNTFVNMNTKVVEGSSSKRAGDELRQETIKKQKLDDDKETTELQMLVEIIPNEEEVAVDVIPLATKPLVIVDYKIHKEEKTSYYKITRANGSFKLYKVFIQLLKIFDREDLETL
ncbi:hypothetical protein Tco_0024138 [Tanacetum coccineum]